MFNTWFLQNLRRGLYRQRSSFTRTRRRVGLGHEERPGGLGEKVVGGLRSHQATRRYYALGQSRARRRPTCVRSHNEHHRHWPAVTSKVHMVRAHSDTNLPWYHRRQPLASLVAFVLSLFPAQRMRSIILSTRLMSCTMSGPQDGDLPALSIMDRIVLVPLGTCSIPLHHSLTSRKSNIDPH